MGSSPDSADAERQHVWGQRYIDDLVLRDRDLDDDGSLDERLYGLQDANWNVVALIDTSATPKERNLYSPFGTPTFLDGAMNVEPASAIDGQILFTGQRFDGSTLLHLFRNRVLNSTIGSFGQRDPLNYIDGANTYSAWFVPHSTDPKGLACKVKSFTFQVYPCTVYDRNKIAGWPNVGAFGGFAHPFEARISFASPCKCCEYRQWVVYREYHQHWSGLPPNDPLLGTDALGRRNSDQIFSDEGHEDTVGDFRYGVRDDPNFNAMDQKYYNGGCSYANLDMPGMRSKNYGFYLDLLRNNAGAKLDFYQKLRFIGNVVDTCCQGTIVATEVLDLECHITVMWNNRTRSFSVDNV